VPNVRRGCPARAQYPHLSTNPSLIRASIGLIDRANQACRCIATALLRLVRAYKISFASPGIKCRRGRRGAGPLPYSGGPGAKRPGKGCAGNTNRGRGRSALVRSIQATAFPTGVWGEAPRQA
jgi:hypothetical protein